jgi:hypothetical protein
MRDDEQIANDWLKQNGIAVKRLLKCDLLLQQAQMVATNLIAHHANWLNSEQRNLLTTYTKTSKQNKAAAFKVLNIGKQLNRELFRQNKRK